MTDTPAEILVVMPAYNEQDCVEAVVREWFAKLERHTREFILLAINDGSTDQTVVILEALRNELGSRLEILTHSNRGHGQSCLTGYRIALERRIPFVFQIDSDGQSDPRYFGEFWARRNLFEVIYGKRLRTDGFRRVFASFILRLALRWVARVDCVDANVPYRLMNTQACAEAISRVPEGVFLANVALSVVLRRDPNLNHGTIPIGFPPRRGGEPSVPLRNFAKKAVELFKQLRQAGIC